MATRCGSLWFVLGVVGGHIMEEDHQEKQSHPHHVGEYRQLYVRYHFPLRKRRLRGVSPHSVTHRTASLASQPYLHERTEKAEENGSVRSREKIRLACETTVQPPSR